MSREESAVNYHNMTVAEALKKLDSSLSGLSDNEVEKRRAVFGNNELSEGKKRTLIERFLLQFKDVMVIILIIAAVISAAMGELTDTSIILVVVVLNAILGVIQESKAEKALEALKNMSKPYSKVKRNGTVIQIRSSEIVPGDLVIIEAGDIVPADLRLAEAASLKIEEAALTGESVPVEKMKEAMDKADVVLGDRKNMAFSGSSVSYGRGMGIAVNTGMATEVGKIAGYINTGTVEETPLQKKLAELGKYLSAAVIAIAVIVFAVGLLRGRAPFEMFLTAVSLAVAAIPEGLPAIVTIVLAIGVQKMSGKSAIIRKLPAVETLGSTDIICSDKTGTLTQNKMTVKEIYTCEREISGSFEQESEQNTGFDDLIRVMVLCNDSKSKRVENGYQYTGDPTETALVTFASSLGIHKEDMDSKYPREAEIPFDSDRKLMTTVNRVNGGFRIFTKGAPDVLLHRCTAVYTSSGIVPMTDKLMEEIKLANSSMASKALRVLAFAYRDIKTVSAAPRPEEIESGLIFSGLAGMIDPPREEAKNAVETCRRAGIRPVMITGDHRDTAAAIARELGIIKSEDEVITGSELDRISPEAFRTEVRKYSVYARVSPEHKVRIVNAWKQNGKIVAMTGDGVNDAPALKTADIGVGMGITGTDVSKGVSDMVLADDNFATIVVAVREGRKIYSNIKKAVQFLLSANMGEIATLFVATMLNWKILFPIHILWINLVTDALPALALGVEKAEKDIMEKKPEKAGFFSNGLGGTIIYQGAVEGLITLLTFYLALRFYSQEVAVTMAFVTLGLIQLVHSFNVRSRHKSLFKIGPFTNVYLTGAVLISALLQVVVVLIPQLNFIFRVRSLSIQQWLITLTAAFLIIPAVELAKLVQRRKLL